MNEKIYSVITATGSCIPGVRAGNKDFLQTRFYQPDGKMYEKSNRQILEKFEEITGIKERRYIPDNLVTSDIASYAAEDALVSANIDREALDYIIVAHNFGDVKASNKKSDIVPALASRVKRQLGIRNPGTIAYDICFGCPGWLQGVIQADYYLKSGDAKLVLVIGAETLSRVSDPHDRDSMLYADGAGAVVLEAVTSDKPTGILAHAARSDTIDFAYLLKMGLSNNPHYDGSELFLKMNGRKLYEYALGTVPIVVDENLRKAGVLPGEVKKILLHQANAKMDFAIVKRWFKSHGRKEIPPGILPMTIDVLGNSSVATIPTLLDLVLKGEMPGHHLEHDDIIIFASVGAGMNINSAVYKINKSI
jgi:3-oxoacyl-[acyl-carrier-protein] synthase-3